MKILKTIKSIKEKNISKEVKDEEKHLKMIEVKAEKLFKIISNARKDEIIILNEDILIAEIQICSKKISKLFDGLRSTDIKEICNKVEDSYKRIIQISIPFTSSSSIMNVKIKKGSD